MRRIAIILVLFQLIGCAPYKLTDMHSNMATTLGQLHRRVSELHKRVDDVHDRHDTLHIQHCSTSFYTFIGVGLGALSLAVNIISIILDRIDIHKLKETTEIHHATIGKLPPDMSNLSTNIETLTASISELTTRMDGISPKSPPKM